MTSLTQLENSLRHTLSKARLTLTCPPYCPEVKLNLYDPSVLEGPISHDEAQKVVAEPAYWSFCWASGQVLAAYILANPESVKGKRVLDVGSGSGVVAVAAALGGAASVIACDIDADALLACQVNAASNGIELETLDDLSKVQGAVDLITAADVLYDRDNFELLGRFKHIAPKILLADSRVKQFPDQDYTLLTKQEARTCPDLNEFEEFNIVRIYSV